MSKSLQQLLCGLTDNVAENTVVAGICDDSRVLAPGEIFVDTAISHELSESYTNLAITRGARVIITENKRLSSTKNCQMIHVEDVADVLALMAARFFDHPSYGLSNIAVTGTNGKTTVAYLLAQLLSLLKQPSIYSGTLGFGFCDDLKETGYTTPPALLFQKQLKEAKSNGAIACVAEVSSHALAQKRVDYTLFKTAILTNLSQDHLDFHITMKKYAEAKARLFLFTGLQNAVINIDDAFGKALSQTLMPSTCIWKISLDNPEADIFCSNIVFSASGMSAILHTPHGKVDLRCNLIGRFNLYNLLCVFAAAMLEGHDIYAIAAVLPELKAPAGRMQFVRSSSPSVVIDYAHTPDALRAACENLRQHLSADGRLLVVFGCGGDRDVDKRPLMGAAADEFADLVVLTSDNPRSESPEEIIDQTLQGVSIGKSMVVEPDRAKAIRAAISRASNVDIVLIAGKGHEDYQVINGKKLPFSDYSEAQSALVEAGYDIAS